jgi:hypothetical protein
VRDACPDVHGTRRGQPNRALIKGTVLVPSRRDLPGAVIPGTTERGSPQGLSRSEPKVADEPGKLEQFDYSAYPRFPEASQFRHRSDRLGIYSGSFRKKTVGLRDSAFSTPRGADFFGSIRPVARSVRRRSLLARFVAAVKSRRNESPPPHSEHLKRKPSRIAPRRSAAIAAPGASGRQADTPAVSAGACRDGRVPVRRSERKTESQPPWRPRRGFERRRTIRSPQDAGTSQ